MRHRFTLQHPNMEIAVIEWSDGSVNKFHAEDKEEIDDFITAKSEAHKGIIFNLKVVTLMELLDTVRNER